MVNPFVGLVGFLLPAWPLLAYCGMVDYCICELPVRVLPLGVAGFFRLTRSHRVRGG